MQNKQVSFYNFIQGHLTAIKTTHFLEILLLVLKFYSFNMHN